jgi:hypothetical protein
MTERFAIYFAPGRDSLLGQRAEAWLAQPELEALTVSARRYGFHATLKAPMALAAGVDRAQVEMAVAEFAGRNAAVEMELAARLIDGFLALTAEPQRQELTDFAASVVVALEPLRALLAPAERARRLRAPLSARQIELLDRYGYPYVLEEFQFHMTLTDRLAVEQREPMRKRAADWFAEALAEPVVLDRLVLFHEAELGAAFRRLDDFVLKGAGS